MYNCDWAGCNHVSAAVTEVKRHRRKHLIDEKQLVKCKADMQAMFDDLPILYNFWRKSQTINNGQW